MPATPRRFLIEGDIETHVIAETYFPEPPGNSAAVLAKSIERQGAIEPVTLFEGRLLDGRVRDRASSKLGKPREAINFEETPQGVTAAALGGQEAMHRAALEYAIAKNVERTHYTQGQLAIIGARMPHREEGRPKKHPRAGEFLRSVAEIAELLGISTGLLSNAKRILREGTSEQIREADAGNPIEPIVMAIKRAAKIRSEPARVTNNNPDIIYGNMDCHEFLPTVKGRSIDLIILDPPYYRVVSAEWDRQWPTIEEYYAWCEKWIAELGRVAKYNCNLLLFGFPAQLCRLMSPIEKVGFSFRQQITIDKGIHSIAGRCNNANLKMVPTATEYIYSFHYDARDYIRDLLQAERRRLKMTAEDCNLLLGKATNGGGTFSSIASEIKPREHREYPTREDWQTFSQVMKLPPYDDVVFSFNLPLGLTDVWRSIEFYNMEERFHPTQKPIALMERLLRMYSLEGQTILDLFAGSGTIAVACKMLGRKFVGCERDKTYFEQSLARIARGDGGAPNDKLLNEIRRSGQR